MRARRNIPFLADSNHSYERTSCQNQCTLLLPPKKPAALIEEFQARRRARDKSHLPSALSRVGSRA